MSIIAAIEEQINSYVEKEINKGHKKGSEDTLIVLGRLHEQIQGLKRYPSIFNEMMTDGLLEENDIKITGDNQYEIGKCNNKMAAYILRKKNLNNRAVSKASLRRLLRQMNNHDWRLTGESIKFDTNGMMFDGHHRLTALSTATDEVSIPLEFRFNFHPDVVFDIDQTNTRQAYQVLTMSGVVSAKVIERMIAYNIQYSSNQKIGDPKKDSRGSIMRVKLSSRELLEYWDKHKDMEDYMVAHKYKTVTSVAILSWINYILHKKVGDSADSFMDSLLDGTNMDKNHPIMVLRYRLMADSQKTNYSASKMSDRTIIYSIIKVWNNLVSGKPLKKVVLSSKELSSKLVIKIPKINEPTFRGGYDYIEEV